MTKYMRSKRLREWNCHPCAWPYMKELKETLDPLVPRLFLRARLFAGPLAPSATALLRPFLISTLSACDRIDFRGIG